MRSILVQLKISDWLEDRPFSLLFFFSIIIYLFQYTFVDLVITQHEIEVSTGKGLNMNFELICNTGVYTSVHSIRVTGEHINKENRENKEKVKILNKVPVAKGYKRHQEQ